MAVSRKRSLRPHVVRRADRWGNDDKEQISLGMGTGEYRELVRDRSGVSEGDFVPEDPVLDAGEDRRPDEAQVPVTEEPHVAELAADLKEAAEAQAVVSAETSRRKYRRVMSKEQKIPELRETAMAAAAETPEKDDDKRAAGIRDASDVPDPVYDDGVSQDEFVPRSMRHLFG